MHKNTFDNYLGINNDMITKGDIFIFYGKSGSGKSSYIQYISKNFPQNFYIIDEVLSIKDYFSACKAIFKNKKVLIASHIHPLFFLVFKILGKNLQSFNLEKYPNKVQKYLSTLGYIFSEKAIRTYSDYFKSTYTDIDIILETSEKNCKNFDLILLLFLKHNNIRLNK